VSSGLPPRVEIPSLAAIGVTAFVTTREAGSFGLPEVGVAPDAQAAWEGLTAGLRALGVPRVASARQVHGRSVLTHAADWTGWRRVDGADGHVMAAPGAAVVTVADCVPVLIGHPCGTVAAVHAGWRGVAAGILGEAVRALAAAGCPASELTVHFGPAICGRCYEVGPDVFTQLTGWETTRPRHVDLRALLAEQAKAAGVVRWSASAECTRCDNAQFFSHRAGDAGRQVAVIAGHSA